MKLFPNFNNPLSAFIMCKKCLKDQWIIFFRGVKSNYYYYGPYNLGNISTIMIEQILSSCNVMFIIVLITVE